MTITTYAKPSCVQCTATERHLTKHGLVPDEIVDLSTDADALDLVRRLGHQQAPVVVIRDEDDQVIEHWSGFRPDKIDQLAARIAA